MEKTEKATEHRKKEAREKEGSVVLSKEVTTACSLLGTFVAFAFLGQLMLEFVTKCLQTYLQNLHTAPAEPQLSFLITQTVEITKYVVLIAGPLLLVSMLLGILPTIVQTRGLFLPKLFQPDFNKLNPISGAKRLFSLQSVVSIIKGLLQITAITVIVYNKIVGILNGLKKLTDMTVMQGLLYAAKQIFDVAVLISVFFAFLAAGDYLYQWWEYERKLRMSKQEIKDEYKQQEGSPEVKSKIKAKQRQLAQASMMKAVPTADVVIRNPTHVAVALKYFPEIKNSSPVVVAKGLDNVALNIIELAERNDVAVITDRPLARKLYDEIDIGKQITVEFLQPVAAILAELDSFKKQMEKLRNDEEGE